MALVLMVGLAVESTAQVRSAALESLIKAAAAEGELNVVAGSPDNPRAWSRWQAAMRAKYGIQVTLKHTPGPQLLPMTARVIEEYKAGRPASTDLLLTAEGALPAPLMAGVLQGVNWRDYVPEVPGDAVAPENSAIAFATVLRGVIYNTRLVPPERIPRTLEDLLDARWKGQIASTLQVVGFVPASIVLGDERITRFLTDLVRSGNLKGLIACGDDQRIAAGEFALQVFACNNRDVELLRRKGAPLAHVLLESIPLVGYVSWAVPKHAVHPNLAKLFAIFMQTPEAQQIMWEDEGFDLHYVQGSNVGKELQAWRGRGVEPKLINAQAVFALGKASQERFAKYLRILQTVK